MAKQATRFKSKSDKPDIDKKFIVWNQFARSMLKVLKHTFIREIYFQRV